MTLNINDDQSIDLLHFIFERELKPPFIRGAADKYGDCHYYNRDGEEIGTLTPLKEFSIKYAPFWLEIRYKVCQAFDVYLHTCWEATQPHLESWLENHLNTELNHIYR